MTMRNRSYALIIAAALVALLAGGCGESTTPTSEPTSPVAPPTAESESPVDPPTADGVQVKVAYLAASPIGDFGWFYNGYEGLQEACERLEYCEIIGFSENVSVADGEPYMRDYAEKGANLIVAHSYGYWEPALKVSPDYPDLVIVYPQGDEDKITTRVGTYYARAEETFYLAGLMAAMMTETDHVGFVLPIQTPMVNNECWGFRQGVDAINPDVEISYVTTDSWYDPPKEREGALALMDLGADFIAYDADSTAIVDGVGERGALVTGVFMDLAYVAPDSVVMSMLWPWDGYFEDVIEAVHNGTFQSTIDLRGIKQGGTDITEFGPMVPQDVQDVVMAARQEIIDGTITVKYIEDVCIE